MGTKPYDVVVVGAGIAGIAAALSARELGARVLLMTDGTLCGGSSFSSNTWGLGMVSESTEPLIRGHQSLFKALKTMGMGLCTPTLPERLVADADEALDWWVRQGASIICAKDPTQREFVPCFDSETRTWHGFVGSESREALVRRIQESGVDVAEQSTLLEIALDKERNLQGIFTLHKMSVIKFAATRAVVLATGGLTGLYGSHICPSTCANGHFAALGAGARLVNIEFQQLMVGYLSPLWGTVFNEKLWRHTLLEVNNTSTDQHFCESEALWQALEAHSWHGPFTFERPSRRIEELLATVQRGTVRAHVAPDALGPHAPEFIRTYASWFAEQKGANLSDSLPIALFAHSSNGGIAIDQDGFTGVPGLYAPGEAAGGVHGADRIGGLASMSALVFGIRAGRAAASSGHLTQNGRTPSAGLKMLRDDRRHRTHVATLLDEVALAPRNHKDLAAGRLRLADLVDELTQSSVVVDDPLGCAPDEARAIGAWRSSLSALTVADALLAAMDARTESRGAHWRSDASYTDNAYDHQLSVSVNEDGQLVVDGCPMKSCT